MTKKIKDIKRLKYNFKNAFSEMNNAQILDIAEEMNKLEEKKELSKMKARKGLKIINTILTSYETISSSLT